MDRDKVNETLDELAFRCDGLSQDEDKALLTAIEVTSFRTHHSMLMKKKDLNRYIEGSKEYLLAKAYNDGVMAVLKVYNSCFTEDEPSEEELEAEREAEAEWSHNDYKSRCELL